MMNMVQRVKATLRQPINGYGLTAVLVSAFGLAGVGLAYGNAQRAETNRVVCSLVAENAATEARKLLEYREEPPATAAGQAQKRAVEVSLTAWQEQGRLLGCPVKKE